ncbi:MAG: DUF6679 family protein [Cyanobacteria bacterium J06627_32]
MLQRKIYRLAATGCEIQVFLRDQNRWIKSAIIHTVDSDLVTLHYKIENNGEISTWEEMVRMDSIGAISRKLQADVPSTPHLANLSPEHLPRSLAPDLTPQSPNQTPDRQPVNG